MDINNIISMQSDAMTESTLESEIDALSKIITDAKDGIKKLENSNEDFKLDGDNLVFNDNYIQCDSVEKDKLLLPSDSLSILGATENINCIPISTTKSNLQQMSNVSLENISSDIKTESRLETKAHKINDSLSLISEAYNSQESQSSKIESLYKLQNDGIEETLDFNHDISVLKKLITNENDSESANNIDKIPQENKDAIEEKSVKIYKDYNFDSNVKFSIQNETIGDFELSKNTNINLTIDNSEKIEKTVTNLIQPIKSTIDIKFPKIINMLENSERANDSKFLLGSKIKSIKTSHDNIETSQNITVEQSNCKQTFRNNDADNSIKVLQCLESIQDLHIDPKLIKFTKKDLEHEAIIPTTEINFTNEIKNSNKTELLLESFVPIENNTNVGETICKNNKNNKTTQNEINFLTNLEPQNNKNLTIHTYETDKDLLELQNIDVTKLSNVSRVKASKNLNINLGFKKSTILDKSNSEKKDSREVLEKLNKNYTDSSMSINIKSNVKLEVLKEDSMLLVKNQIIEKLPEILELESAVRYLQESEKKEIKPIKVFKNSSINKENSSIFVAVEDSVCDNVSELISNLQGATDPIAISEAEIISEAAKLENERKEKLELKMQFKNFSEKSCDIENENITEINNTANADNVLTSVAVNKQLNIISQIPNKDILKASIITKNKSTSESLTGSSILEECYKDLATVEISDGLSKISELPKSTLLINNEPKQRLESPDRSTKDGEIKTSDITKKDFDKQFQQYSETENVGSPRIILKIAKSAIAECSEPRSPKSAKVRSAANSPNPEDNSGQKLGKIKLKLSRSGHPSIIPNTVNYDETAQWHADNTSLSSLGMRIKLTKSIDTTIFENKFEDAQKLEEFKEKISHKSEEIKKTESAIGMKIKLSKCGDASIVHQDNTTKDNVIQENSDIKKQDSPSIGMKIKLSKFGDASIIQQDNTQSINEPVLKSKDKIVDDMQDDIKRTELSIGMKIKLSKSGDAAVVNNDSLELVKESLEPKEKIDDSLKRMDSSFGVKIKLAKMKDGGASIITSESSEEINEKIEITEISKKKICKKKEISETIEGNSEIDTLKQDACKIKISKLMNNENNIVLSEPVDEIAKTSVGMKIKLSKTGDASVMQIKNEDTFVETANKIGDQFIGMKIKFSKSGDSTLIHSQRSIEAEDLLYCIKTKHSKNKDPDSVYQLKSKDDSNLEMKIKLPKMSHSNIITTNDINEEPHINISQAYCSKQKDSNDLMFKESKVIESIKNQSIENAMIDLHNKRKEITLAPIEVKKLKIESNFKQMIPDVTIQPIVPGIIKEQSQQKLLLESNSGTISQQQMNVINREISITQICSLSTNDAILGERLKSTLNVQNRPLISSPLNSDCEIIEPQPELIIVNENSNSSQDIMIIDEVLSAKSVMKMPKKRGRPRRNTTVVTADAIGMSNFQELELQRDPLSLEQLPIPIMLPTAMTMLQQQIQPQIGINKSEGMGTERPRRTCRSQKSYAPPKRGRGRGRGKRKNEAIDIPLKKQRITQDLTAIEKATTTTIAIDNFSVELNSNISNSPEFFKTLNEPILEKVNKQLKEVEILETSKSVSASFICKQKVHEEVQKRMNNVIDTARVNTSTLNTKATTDMLSVAQNKDNKEESPNTLEIIVIKVTENAKESEIIREHAEMVDHKDSLTTQEYQNWLTPPIKKVSNECGTRNESISTITVIDEETRMSAESGSRSQTPARNIAVPGTTETLVNEESQGSVLSTATTESEKVKVKNRRMEISFDPDEGPFTVEKIAEYEWPLEKKDERPAGRGETFMIQEQISQYLGVKSFKRKYPDLKRRMVDMEERNFLRENGLVSESMCDMGLTAVSSSEVLDIMCSDFQEQYEEYRKHMREKAAKEHSKKQKELSAAANAERNRIDLAEMAMQSALSWNTCLNKARQDSRKCSLDLQTFTVHMPKRSIKLDSAKSVSHYPVALIPGQYTDFYRDYTPAELRYYPLNTVLYGPMRPNERKFDSQSEGSQSDSDSDSSSDDSSSSSSEGTQDTEGSQSTMDEVDMDLTLQTDIKCKMCLNNFNKNNRPEVLIQCGTCSGNVHPSCIDLTIDMVPHIRAYAWQCTDCKTCAQCHDPADEDKMLFCDMCDRGYHIYCVGLRRVPQGRWHCQECAVCANCGSKEPGGPNSDRNSVAQWQHEYKKGEKNMRVYVSTFCVPCSKLWRKGRYCPHCSRCHNAPRLDLEANLVHCGACDKYLHLDCVETKGQIIDKQRYYCEFCSPNIQQLAKSLISKILQWY
ncbi:PREDICTED: uncharacterized protein LOC105361725 [Ceratosolen solmsi marchali]|uniref:Uncharacterized protein LOC105361725 n=1 Tax=Ceratosolen solmsi marchali TaxID=326594 RepID=A0AAJ7DUV7_9HYME|nr:PREDICTED: uncharacterized protein LOC105361725 [Ceratosolen solmsi marchali]